jgi:hypothetical protein
MALIEVNWNPSQRELRQFSLLLTVFLCIVGAYFFWINEEQTAAIASWVVASASLACYFVPGILRPVYVTWMALVLPIGWTISHLLLLALFFAVVTPIGLIMKLLGYDPLMREVDRSAKSYWVEHSPPPDPVRYFKQY